MDRGIPLEGHLRVPRTRPEVLDLAGLRGVVVVDGDSHGVRLGGSYARRHIAEEDEKLFIRLRDVVVDDPNADTLFAVRVGDGDCVPAQRVVPGMVRISERHVFERYLQADSATGGLQEHKQDRQLQAFTYPDGVVFELDGAALRTWRDTGSHNISLTGDTGGVRKAGRIQRLKRRHAPHKQEGKAPKRCGSTLARRHE